MSDESYEKIAAARRGWKSAHMDAYLGSGGARGHIMNFSDIGGPALVPTLLLRYTGRKSGNRIVTPLIYGVVGGEVVIVASKGGANDHPAWYLNLRDGSEVAFQIATEAFRASWREAQGAERAKVWDFMVSVFPPFAGYQASTDREIPLVMLTAAGAIDTFLP